MRACLLQVVMICISSAPNSYSAVVSVPYLNGDKVDLLPPGHVVEIADGVDYQWLGIKLPVSVGDLQIQ